MSKGNKNQDDLTELNEDQLESTAGGLPHHPSPEYIESKRQREQDKNKSGSLGGTGITGGTR